ncbi:hypothetical protein K488DRAFT_75003 [Vararia minispora EC-137]|uniref:Uncharacterized protein n=1 Tax=Vararia minispora EC-137 TaxID=1314806 RepID=A0ACB8Q542_9AGAM|nr:hypothetical protein K488DRAFT_75003 [Vararia minispora EC-137]
MEREGQGSRVKGRREQNSLASASDCLAIDKISTITLIRRLGHTFLTGNEARDLSELLLLFHRAGAMTAGATTAGVHTLAGQLCDAAGGPKRMAKTGPVLVPGVGSRQSGLTWAPLIRPTLSQSCASSQPSAFEQGSSHSAPGEPIAGFVYGRQVIILERADLLASPRPPYPNVPPSNSCRKITFIVPFSPEEREARFYACHRAMAGLTEEWDLIVRQGAHAYRAATRGGHTVLDGGDIDADAFRHTFGWWSPAERLHFRVTQETEPFHREQRLHRIFTSLRLDSTPSDPVTQYLRWMYPPPATEEDAIQAAHFEDSWESDWWSDDFERDYALPDDDSDGSTSSEHS